MRCLKLKDVGKNVLLRNNSVWKITWIQKIPNSPPWSKFHMRKNWFNIELEKDGTKKLFAVSKKGKIHYENKVNDFDIIQIYSTSSFNFIQKCFQE